MTKHDSSPAPEVKSRENAKDARAVETGEQAGEQAAMPDGTHEAGSVPGMTVASFPGSIDPASHAIRRDTQQEQSTHQLRTDERPAKPGDPDHTEPMGNVPATAAVESPADDPVSRAKALAASVMNRLKAEKRWFGLVDLVRDQMMKDAKASMPDLVQRQLWVYGELDRLYPPNTDSRKQDMISCSPESGQNTEAGGDRKQDMISCSSGDAGSIQGLSDLPVDWPKLPPNASLGVELGWVQANRLSIVEERPGKATIVRLDRAASPAPSLAALGWLETSIRSYAKYVDVAAKAASGGDDDEGAVMRRERKSLEEVRALIQEMAMSSDACPHCGRSG